MNETATEKQPAKKGPTVVEKYFEALWGDGKLTRIPVAHLYYADTIDHSGGWESQMSNSTCYRPGQQPPNVNRYFVADFIPAWQCFEVSVISGPGAEPKTELLPAIHVRRFKRFV